MISNRLKGGEVDEEKEKVKQKRKRCRYNRRKKPPIKEADEPKPEISKRNHKTKRYKNNKQIKLTQKSQPRTMQ